MKTAFLTAIAIALFTNSFAAPTKYKLLKNTTNLTAASSWSPVGLPKNGDTILIPNGLKLTLSTDITLNDIYIDLYGSIILSGNNMKAKLTGKSIINIHTGATMYGNRASQQVELNGLIYKGNLPVLTGPMLATSNSSGFKPYIEFTILPVKFLSFSVTRSNAAILVQWTTTEESNAAYYEVQRSNGTTWNVIATLHATGKPTNNYVHTDRSSAAGTTSYRIKQVDTDGAFSYTEVRMLKSSTVTAPVITAMPKTILVQFTQQVKGKVMIEVIGQNGNVVMKQTINEPAATVQWHTGLKGLYIVRVSNGQNFNTAKQIVL